MDLLRQYIISLVKPESQQKSHVKKLLLVTVTHNFPLARLHMCVGVCVVSIFDERVNEWVKKWGNRIRPMIIDRSAGMGSNGVTVTKFLQFLMTLELYLELILS